MSTENRGRREQHRERRSLGEKFQQWRQQRREWIAGMTRGQRIRHRLLQAADAVPPQPGGILQKQRPPGSLAHIGDPLQLPRRLLLLQPAQGLRVALDPPKHIQHDLGQAAVVPSGGEGVHQKGKVPLWVDALVLLLQHILQHLGHHHMALPLVAQAEVRVQIQQVPALPKEGCTEGVNGGDLRLIDQGGLPAEVPVIPFSAEKGIGRDEVLAHIYGYIGKEGSEQ